MSDDLCPKLAWYTLLGGQDIPRQIWRLELLRLCGKTR